MAAQQIWIYTVYIVSGGTKYNVTRAVVSQDRLENEKEIAQRIDLVLQNVQVDGKWLSTIITPRSRVYIYAKSGSEEKEVFRGFLWNGNSKHSLSDRELRYIAYDNLIYLQESEDSLYFSSGKTTKDICTTICDKWGIKLDYSYDSITHAKLPLRGNLSDIFTADILDLVKKRTGKKYVILSEKDTMYIKPVGANTTIYHFLAGKNVNQTASGWTMEGVITKVVITGKADSNDREPIEATVAGDTDQYGTLQKIQSRSENTSLSDAKLEAKTTIDEDGKPKWEWQLSGPDIPWVRKGDKVYVDAGDIKGYKIVTEVDRTINNKKHEIILTLKDE